MCSSDFFAQIFGDKDIALVGNSQKVFDSRVPLPVDDHELVIRMNRAWALSRKQRVVVGSRTDVLLASTELDYLKKAAKVVDRIVWMDPRKQEKAMATGIPIAAYPIRWWGSLIARIGAIPSTGCMAIDLISKYVGGGRVTLYGFDFLESPNWWNYKRKSGASVHDGQAEKQFIMSLNDSMEIKIVSI